MKNSFLIAFAFLFIVLLGIIANREMQKDSKVSGEYRKDVPIGSPKSELEDMISEKSETVSVKDFVVNLQNKPDYYIVTVNTPGVDVSDVDVKLVDRQLDISIKISNAERQAETKNGDYRYLSRYMGEFSKSITLPGPVDKDKITSDFKDGLLTVTIPKK